MRRGNKNRIDNCWISGSLLVMLVTAVSAFGQSPGRSFQVSGVVVDPGGAVIAEAAVIIRRKSGGFQQTASTNEGGEFRFTGIESGPYEIKAQKEGFKPAVTQLTVGTRSPSPLRIVLSIADLHEELAIGEGSAETNTNPDENLDVIKLDREALGNLPVLGNDVIASTLRLLDAGSIGAGGPSIIVDGLETTDLKVAASTIKDVRINQNPYSAEFSRPGRGRTAQQLAGAGLGHPRCEVAKEFEWKKDKGPTLTVGVDAFNVLNRTNYTGFVGNLSSPFFGLPVAAHPARRMQLTLGFSF